MILRLACRSCGHLEPETALATLCTACGRSLSAEYDLEPLKDAFRSGALAGRERSMWRYREALPVAERVVSLGEGFTPLLALPRLGARYGLKRLLVKDEGGNPTGSFKARGMSAAVTAAAARGARVLAAPSAGNAAGALAAYAARAGLEARVFLPATAPAANRAETILLGAHTTTVPGTIADAARCLGQARATDPGGAAWFDLSTLKEPYRLDGKKTMGYELFEQLAGELPDAILYPTGGGTGLLGMMKAFDELERMGLIGGARPRMIAVQSTAAPSIVTAWEQGREESEPALLSTTVAAGLQVPKAFADWWILQEIRRSGGAALAVDDPALLAGVREVARREGLLFCPEAGALVAALPRLIESGRLAHDERIVLFNTATGYKYPELLAAL